MNKNLIEQLRTLEEITEELKSLHEDTAETIACFHDFADGLEDEYPEYMADINFVKGKFEEEMKKGGEMYQ